MTVQTDIQTILRESKVIAIVGLSPKPERASHMVAAYLKKVGYTIIPVNPGHSQILDGTSYASLKEIPHKVDIVDVFRRAEHTPEIAQAAVDIGAKVLWLQLGISSEVSEKIALTNGLKVVMDKCIKIEHARLS
ncbi:MAG: CoA-binding protein [Arenicellales bacterium]